MKTRFTSLLLSAALIITGCGSYDDSDLQNKFTSLETRIESLEKEVSKINTNITALQKVASTISDGSVITSVEEVTDVDGDVTGYTITFSDSQVITVYNGADGKSGVDGNNGSSPVIGVKKNTDGVLYWTLNGEYLLCDGEKIPAEGMTPRIRINNGDWEVSYDGTNWTVIASASAGSSGDSIFSEVNIGTDSVIFKLTDGTSFEIPYETVFALVLNQSDTIVISAGETKTISYTVTGASEETTVKCMTGGSFSAKVTATDHKSGNVTVTAPSTYSDGSVLLFADNGKGKTSLKLLEFKEGVFTVVTPSEAIPAAGGAASVKVTTNVDYTVSIDVPWLTLTQTKAVRTDELVFTATANTGASIRTATVTLLDSGNAALQTIQIAQSSSAVVLSDTFDWADTGTDFTVGSTSGEKGFANFADVSNGWTSEAVNGNINIWVRDGYFRFSRTGYGGILVSPALSSLTEATDVTVSFKAARWVSSSGVLDANNTFTIAVRNGGTASQTSFVITNYSGSDTDSATWQDDPAAVYTFTISGATTATQIVFISAPGSDGTMTGTGRMLLDDVKVMR